MPTKKCHHEYREMLKGNEVFCVFCLATRQIHADDESTKSINRIGRAMLATLGASWPCTGETTKETGEEKYIVYVDYKMPSFNDLKKEFDNVSVIFDGRPFEYHPSCANIDQTPGKREMLVKHFDREIKSEEAITEMDAKGYRPAIHLEARDFAKAHPELQRKFWIAALGAFALDDGSRCVALLFSVADRRIFGIRWFDCRWDAGNRFLFVRK